MTIALAKIKQTLLLGSVLLASLVGQLQPSRAADQPNVLIMGEDADEDTVPRHSRIFNRVSDALRTRMMELGFKVYNETATTMDITDPSRVRRTDAELISVAQNITAAPIDVITAFQIYASSQPNAYSDITQLRIRIVGRMLQVQTGRDLGNFEVAVGPRGLKPIPPRCDRECVLEHVGSEAKPIANEVGTILARKLDELSPVAPKSENIVTLPAPVPTPPPRPQASENTASKDCVGLSTAYTIVLTGFDPADVDAIERMLVAFQGYEHHRPIKTQTRHAEYWYETCSDRARLERNLRALVDMMPGPNRIALNGNRFEIEKIPGVGKR
jgi:hypothetical protein